MTGGREECWWDCYKDQYFYDEFLLPPSCLADCYPPDHCLSSLLADYQAAGGICPGSYLDVYYAVPVSNQSCENHDLCSERTKLLLMDQENCVHPIYNQKESMFNTIHRLIESMCDYQTYSDFRPAPLDRKVNTKKSLNADGYQ